MTLEPLISVIIPTYNRSWIIEDALNSVLNQTYSNWECIIVDDGSTDKTEEKLEAWCNNNSGFKFFLRPNNRVKGASSCRNVGLEKAEGDFILFLDSDDLLLESCLENRIKQLSHFQDNFFWVFPMVIENDSIKFERTIPDKDSYLEDFLSYDLHWQTMCTLWDVQFLRSLGGFDPAYLRLNDPELHIRAMLRSEGRYRVFSKSNPDCVYRVAEIKCIRDYVENYYESLFVFSSRISKELRRNNMKHLLPLIKSYFLDYMNYYKNISTKKNFFLFSHLFRMGILSKGEYFRLIVSIFLYAYKIKKGRLKKILNEF